MRPRDHISCTLWDIIYTAVYGRRQCSNFARALHLSREFVPAKRICSCEENCRQTYTDWTAVSPKQQKQESLTCFIRFYLTVVNVTADEKIMKDGRPDMSLVNAIAFDPYTHGYYKVTERVGEAFKDGLKLK